jgi:hypothetical protein
MCGALQPGNAHVMQIKSDEFQPGDSMMRISERISEKCGPVGVSLPVFLPVLLILPVFAGGPASAQIPADAVRVCLAFPTVEFAVGDASQAAEAVRTTLAAYLEGPSIEPVPLTSRVAAQAMQEAQQSDCGYVLHTSVTLKRGDGRVLGRAARTLAAPAATQVAVSSSMGVAARATAISGVYAAAELASSVRARDEVTLEYRLESPSPGSGTFEGRGTGRARTDGEDLLTPLIAAAAEALANRILSP